MKRENPQLKQIEGLVKELLEREGLTAEGGPWRAGWIQSCWKGLLPKWRGWEPRPGAPGQRTCAEAPTPPLYSPAVPILSR